MNDDMLFNPLALLERRGNAVITSGLAVGFWLGYVETLCYQKNQSRLT